ncbi:hypothetical protein [Moorena sp. SIO4G3]|uniref:hypothetical protein n=1 Tax=Moorena sp. SIO4G3 TaxID=2607821 RepID=UPI00142A9861|nr:hypothetical protein [Moorena sp. SIO4G3]NEO81645.1 hypothetical protein [Moorena sp. SIO4G3]
MNYALSQQAKTDEGGIANVQMLCISDMLPVQKTCNTKVETTMQTGNYPLPSSVRDVESSPSKLVDRDESLAYGHPRRTNPWKTITLASLMSLKTR